MRTTYNAHKEKIDKIQVHTLNIRAKRGSTEMTGVVEELPTQELASDVETDESVEGLLEEKNIDQNTHKMR